MLTLRAGVVPIAATHATPTCDPHAREISASAECPDAAWAALEAEVPQGWHMMWVTRD